MLASLFAHFGQNFSKKKLALIKLNKTFTHQYKIDGRVGEVETDGTAKVTRFLMGFIELKIVGKFEKLVSLVSSYGFESFYKSH